MSEKTYRQRLKIILLLYFVNQIIAIGYLLVKGYPFEFINTTFGLIAILTLIPYIHQMRVEKKNYLSRMLVIIAIGGNNERK